MKRIMLIAVVVLSAPSLLYAQAPGMFVNAPESNWPTGWQIPGGPVIENQWVTSPPYQRNILFSFDNALNLTQPTYSGTDDPVLHPSDVVYPGTAFTWFDNDAAFQSDGVARRFGLIGIDNRQGTDNVTSGLQFVIDNWDHPKDWKHIWKEIICFEGPYFEGEKQLSAPTGFTVLEQDVINEDLGDNWTVLDTAYKVYPNPPWEQVTLIVHVPAGSFILADEIHFATECVPEPTTMTLLTLGGALIAMRRRRKRHRST